MPLAQRFASQSDLTVNELAIPDFTAPAAPSATTGLLIAGAAAAHTIPAGVWVAGQILTPQQIYQAAYAMALAQTQEASRLQSALFRRLTAPGLN